MTLCSHQQWLRIHQEGNEFILQDGNRLGHIAKSFPRPAKQYPSLVHFIGTQNKSRALRAIFPENSISNCRKYGVANICADLKTSLSDYPILIAESTPDHVQANLRGKLVCHETTNNPVAWQDDESGHCTAQSLADYLHARLLSMFVDVLCLFAEDYGSLDHLAERLASWTTLGSASSLPTNTRPRLIVITSIPGHTFNAEALRFRLTVLSHPKFAGSFASLKLVNVLGSKNRSSTLFSGVEEVIRHDINLARIERGNAHAMFSMVHIARFFASALHNFCTSPRHTFDFIKSSRESNPLSPNLENHLRSFLRLSLEHMLNDSILWSFISSAIMLDFFPPDMHCKYYPSFEEPANTDRGQVFNPSEVFRVMYYQVCVAAISDFATSTNSSGEVICGKIEAQMIQMFSFMKFEGNSAAILRLQCLREDSGSWQLLKSNVDCFICLQRKPEHITECGHGLCDFCIRIPNFSKPMKGREYCYEIDNCPQCQREIHFQARTLPPTCRIRFLGIDGGGSRGIVSLGFIEALREALGLNYPVQENFDYAIGTSSGGIATIGLFGKDWSPQECLNFFRKFAIIIFPPKAAIARSICGVVRRILSFSLQDGKYNSSILEDALQEALGPALTFGPVGLRTSGMKFAVTTTTITDATLCLISNYNGNGQHKNSRYKHLRALRPTEEIKLWEAYFKPKQLRDFGTFQDGGLKYNNPVRPGLREVQRIWEDRECDIVLSIGTGYEQKLTSPVASNVRNLFQDGTLARFYRAALQSLSLNGQLSWEDHWSGLPDDAKKQQFRLNLPLVGKEPSIDDVGSMQYLQDQIQYHLEDIEGIARAFKAVSFFFELNGLPLFEGGRYCCRGSVLSRSPNSLDLIRSLGLNYPYAQFFNQDVPLGFLRASDICTLCGCFQKEVTFYVRHPTDRVNLQLVFNRLYRRSISAFPQSLDWFVDRQKLDAYFGQPDHKSRTGHSREHRCPCEVRRRQDVSTSEATNKKRSLPLQMRVRKKRRY